MKFRAELSIKRWAKTIAYEQQIMLMGSCFTEHVGKYLTDRKFNTLSNPNGILFNPISIANALSSYIDNQVYSEKDVFNLNDIWTSWDHHSQFSNTNIEACLKFINTTQQAAHQYIQKTQWLMITWGSAFVYELTQEAQNNNSLAKKPIGKIVANCHKAPSDWFNRRLLSVDEILNTFNTLIGKLLKSNPQLHIILTISPVRHLREGLIDNNRSKAVLIQAVHQLCEIFDRVHYFPSYELVIDDLRDYRFYAEDLVHPNHQATQYVWEKFVEMCIHADSVPTMQTIEKIRAAYLHKPLHPQSQQHQTFLKSYLEKTKLLQQQFPEIDFSNEINYFGM